MRSTVSIIHRFRTTFVVGLKLRNYTLQSGYLISILASTHRPATDVDWVSLFQFLVLYPQLSRISNFLHTISHYCFKLKNHFFLLFYCFFINVNPLVFFGHSLCFIGEGLNVVFLSYYNRIQLHGITNLRLHGLDCPFQLSIFYSLYFIKLRNFNYLLF